MLKSSDNRKDLKNINYALSFFTTRVFKFVFFLIGEIRRLHQGKGLTAMQINSLTTIIKKMF